MTAHSQCPILTPMRPISLGFSAALLTLTTASFADVAPPPNYVESCTVAQQSGPGLDCRECGTYYAEHDKCEKTLGTQGFSKRCRSRGASVWTEVWCRSAQAAPPQPDPDPHPSDPNYAKPPPGPAAIATDPAPVVASDPAQQPAPMPPRSGCGSCSVGRSAFGVSALLAAAMGAVLLIGRRRRR